MLRLILIRSIISLMIFSPLFWSSAHAASCEKVVHDLNTRLSATVGERELVDVLRSLNETNNKRLPQKFVTKREAKELGWKPGRDLWSVKALRSSSIGGDRFGNHERRLPDRKWREADLDYRGGHRSGKRIVFSTDGKRMVTVDHYQTFTEVPPCQ